MSGLPPLPLQDSKGFWVTSDSLLIGFIWHLLRTLESHCVSGGRSQPSVFSDKKKYWQNQGIISAEVARSSDVFIKHNFDRHDGLVPLWATVEVMSFGSLSKTVKN